MDADMHRSRFAAAMHVLAVIRALQAERFATQQNHR